MQLNHKLIPVRNIDLKFNLSETPHYLYLNGKTKLLEDVYFSGLQDHYKNAYFKINGKIDMLGICFLPGGIFPFLKRPLSEFKNQLLGAREIGFNEAIKISERLKEAHNTATKLMILENELLLLIDKEYRTPRSFEHIFRSLNPIGGSIQIAEFCHRNDIGIRKLERLYNKYIGISPKAYCTLSRFQNSINRILHTDYTNLSDIAYDNGYFDQMHFIKEFKRFAGSSPKSFVRSNNSMLQIGKFA